MLRSLKVTLLFLILGVTWLIWGSQLITSFLGPLTYMQQKLIDAVFIVAVAFILYLTEKKRTQQQNQDQYKQLFESNPNPLWIYDNATLRFIKVNQAAVEKYQYSMDQFQAMTIMDIRPAEDRDKLAARIKSLKNEVRTSGRWRHIKANGGIIDVSIVSYPVMFNDRQCCLVIATDITELAEKEQKLQTAYQKIKSFNDTLRQIAWSNSHEMRKPVCSIISLVSLLKHTDNNQERRQYLNLLETAATELDNVLKQNEKMTEVESEVETL